MSVIKLNGVRIDLTREYPKDFKNGQLNQLLGQDGMPKYSANQMKSKTKAMLLEEVNVLIAEAVAAGAEQAAPKERKPAGAKMRPSKNLNVARSKKCRTLAKLADGKMTIEQALTALDEDALFAKICTREEIETASKTGMRPRQSAQERVVVTFDENDAPVVLKPNERMNKRGDIIADAAPNWAAAEGE